MKKSLALFALLLMGTVGITNTAKAQDNSAAITACLVDGFGYTWNLTHVTKGGGVYTGTGTIDVGAGFLWNATVTYNTHTGATTLRADNPQADGCQSGFTDYFEYTGTAVASYHHGAVEYDGSGTWQSFCSGSVINTGTWSATDCAGKRGTVNPNGPALTSTKSSTSQDKAAAITACLVDGFGYTWNLTHVTKGGGVYTGTGTIDVGAGFLWNATVTYNTHTGATTLRADNPQADGCQSGFTDYFEYTGTAVASYHHGAVEYDGSGTWQSFCSGSVINTGTWSATDCAGKHGTINPNGPAKHGAVSLIKVSPNPINSQANISYSVAKSGQVNITVYNSMQQTVKVLVNDFKNAGNYSTIWDARSSNVNAGVYRVVAVVDGKTYSTTVQVVR
jgi:hypothetical protein